MAHEALHEEHTLLAALANVPAEQPEDGTHAVPIRYELPWQDVQPAALQVVHVVEQAEH